MLFCITSTERASKRKLPLGGVHSDCCWHLIRAADGLLTCVARGGSNRRGTAGEALVLEVEDPVGGRGALVSGAVKAGDTAADFLVGRCLIDLRGGSGRLLGE